MELKHCVFTDRDNDSLMPHIAKLVKVKIEAEAKSIRARHLAKIEKWSNRQDSPVCKIEGTIRIIGEIKTQPDYVIETLKYGPRNPILTRFDDKDTLCEMDLFLEYCETKLVKNESINDFNMHTHKYCKQAKTQVVPRNIQKTYEYLKESKLKAVPFDKGLGFCLMTEKDYHSRLEKITGMKQFKYVEKTRKNEKHPVLKEEERIVNELKTLLKNGDIDDELYNHLRPTGSKPAQIYGLSKVHKDDTPLRPIVSIPGTSYDKIGRFVSKWLEKVPESKIQTSSKDVKNEIKEIMLNEGEKLVSYDIVQLYTYVPLAESIEIAAKKLYKKQMKCLLT